MTRAHRASAALAAVLIGVTGCLPRATPAPATPSQVATPAAAPITSDEPNPTAAGTPASPTATPEPSLSLDPPASVDPRVVTVAVEPDVGDDGGEILVTVTNRTDQRIDELVLRWPTALHEVLFPAPFVPSAERIREDGPPLVQPWTKWVVGPGEQGEPEGTTSLGYGPLLPGASLSIPLFVTRRAPGPVAFDLQALAGNDLLTLEGGDPADVRVEIP